MPDEDGLVPGGGDDHVGVVDGGGDGRYHIAVASHRTAEDQGVGHLSDGEARRLVR